MYMKMIVILAVVLVFDTKIVRLEPKAMSAVSHNIFNNNLSWRQTRSAQQIADAKTQIDINNNVPKSEEPAEPLNDQHAGVPSKVAKPLQSGIVNTTATKINKTTEKIPNEIDNSQPSLALTPAAFLRGFYVFAGLGFLVMIYLGMKTIRVGKTITAETTVRKYGVTAKRGDLEMLPLPLAEEDDDDTLFDVGNHLRPDSAS